MTDERPVPVALCFDVEPDAFDVALEPGPWRGFERLLDRVDGLRAELTAATGRAANFNWFLRMDPQIEESHGDAGWVTGRYGDRLASLRTAGDAIGVHPHAWRRSTGRGRWIADHDDPDWVDHCIDISLEAYRRAFGEACRSMRMGDRFVTGRAIRHAAASGILYDLSVEPGTPAVRSLHRGVTTTGRIPGQAHAPLEVYRPSATDPLRHVDASSEGPDVWIIPLTAIDPGPLLPSWRRVARRVRHPLSPGRRVAPLASKWAAAGFWEIVEAQLETSQHPHLAFAVRSDTTIDSARNDRFEAKLATLVATTLVRRLAFTTPDALVAAVKAPRSEIVHDAQSRGPPSLPAMLRWQACSSGSSSSTGWATSRRSSPTSRAASPR